MTTIELSRPEIPPFALPAFEPRRRLATLSGEQTGPTLVCIGSLHGNEPAGYWALERVIATLEAARRDHGVGLARGSLVALTGNLAALAAGRRFVDHDLNRGWSPHRIEELRHRPAITAEEREVLELVDCIDEARALARGPLVFLDLHSTSGDSPPFISVADRLRYRRFALQFHAPVVLGLEDYLDATLLEWIDQLGFLGVVFEGGRHEAQESIDNNEAAVWIAISQLGLLGDDAQKDPILGEPIERAHRVLRAASEGLPRMLEIRDRHALHNGQSFRMAPGFRSFQEIKANTLLACEDGKEVRSREGGRLLMPLYQPQGDDGFFVMRSYGWFHRFASWAVRRSNLAAMLPVLPGIEPAVTPSRSPSHSELSRSESSTPNPDEPNFDEPNLDEPDPDLLAVDKRWRRGLRQGILRHFGYHAVAEKDGWWLLRRRV